MTKKKATRKQLQALAKGRAKLAAQRRGEKPKSSKKYKAGVKMAKKKSYRKKASSFLRGDGGVLIGALGYGIARGKISSMMSGLNIPVLNQIGDEAGMLAVTWLVKNNTKGIIKKAATVGFNAEAVALGKQIAENGFKLTA